MSVWLNSSPLSTLSALQSCLRYSTPNTWQRLTHGFLSLQMFIILQLPPLESQSQRRSLPCSQVNTGGLCTNVRLYVLRPHACSNSDGGCRQMRGRPTKRLQSHPSTAANRCIHGSSGSWDLPSPREGLESTVQELFTIVLG